MKITTAKVLRELQEKHNWHVYPTLDKYEQDIVKDAIKDTIKVIDELLKQHKNITIK